MNDVGSRLYNELLNDLPPDVAERISPHLERFDAPLDTKLYKPYAKIRDVYFPLNAVASIVASTAKGHMLEVGVVGREGFVGFELGLGTDTSPNESMIQIPGPVIRMNGRAFLDEFNRAGVFHDRVLSFLQKMNSQVSQTTLCNRLHQVEERMPRWLLMCHDRIAGDVLTLTQEFIGLMLGTSRVSITRAAIALQEIGYIKYTRGKITVLDRGGLEDGACECYKIVKRQYDRKYPF